MHADLPTCHPQACTHTSDGAITFSPASPHRSNAIWWYRNINLLSIDYAFRPRLRVRLTLGGFTVPRNPWVYGEQDSHLLYRYLFRHNHFLSVQASLPSPFTHSERSPTPAERPSSRQAAASVGCLSPGHFRRRTSRPVSYYALFK
jgi:hypothetical protein